MANDDLRERLARFRTEYLESVEASDALLARAVPGGDVERWLRSSPPRILDAARREHEAFLRDLRAEQPTPRRAPARTASGSARPPLLTPDDFLFRTIGR